MILFELVLPDRDDSPSVLFQFGFHSLVSGGVSLEFRHPILAVFLRYWKIADGASVPKAPMHENCQLASWVGNVRMTGGFLPIESIPGKADVAQELSDLHLWLGVAPFVALH